MTLREEFVERVLAKSSPELSGQMRAVEKSYRIAKWVQQWIADNHLPVHTLSQAVQAVAKFKQAIGAEVHITQDDDQITLNIDACPIAALSRANPRLCLLTCHVLGSTAALTGQPIWVSMEQTWALDDQPCRLVVTPHPPTGPVTIPYVASTDYPPVSAAFWERTEELPTLPLSTELSSLLTDGPKSLPDLLAALESYLNAPIWLEEHNNGPIWGKAPHETHIALSHHVYWRNQLVGRLFIQPETAHSQDIVRWLPVLARLTAMSWAETQILPVSWDEGQQLLKILLSPAYDKKDELLERWNQFCHLSSLCPAQVVVCYHPDVKARDRDMTMLRLQQHTRMHASHSLILVGWFQDVLVGLMPKALSESVLHPWTEIIRQSLPMPLGIGVSQNVAHLEDFPYAFHEALQSARFAFEHEINKPLSISSMPGIRLLPYYHKIPEFKAYCVKLLQPLEQEDHLHHTDLLTTLKTYITSQMSIKKASARLYIHPGTLKYRLKQIEELTGWNIHDPLSLWEILTGLMVTGQISWETLPSLDMVPVKDEPRI
ncbi:helix-turn-helix domain-containing protein [Sulfobacillus thermosulfidooxidans]|uniref:helix-turn-helix domain-containing protein n=1 Tax=Sulfobacillus thermosulfidooxidans TaxID=28034 RepID=UPI0002E28BCD|nr:helix-turn-helix domain-containing protein [Sulfobacillus thermosulfidooxidans]